MKKIENKDHSLKCQKKIISKNAYGFGERVEWQCGKTASYEESGRYYCGHHAHKIEAQRVPHNHITRDIKPLGECPACDRNYQKEINRLMVHNPKRANEMILARNSIGHKFQE